MVTKKKVVYILGAGFSAPLGVPVMSNFIRKSKDIYKSNPKEYGYFEEVYDEINKMGITLNYMNHDLDNIENVLSFLEMKSKLENNNKSITLFRSFIANVVNSFTPDFGRFTGKTQTKWGAELYNRLGDKAHHCRFIANLLPIQYIKKPGRDSKVIQMIELNDKEADYSIITLNYDLVIENIIDYLKKSFWGLNIEIDLTKTDSSNVNLPYVKLHGTAEFPKTIVPPTWNKMYMDNLGDEWITSYELLKNAESIRILGYSLPDTDSYIKYLITNSFAKIFNLKEIHVICKDDGNNSVKKRYESMFKSNYLKFINADIIDYFIKLTHQAEGDRESRVVKWDNLELVHRQFFDIE
ncbi:MAG: hypothetical protein P9X24_11325 [Candidatus Hatepunaea meridiana]|nr:hypothetical protein [Candidatus Hatepunaea meridiana]